MYRWVLQLCLTQTHLDIDLGVVLPVQGRDVEVEDVPVQIHRHYNEYSRVDKQSGTSQKLHRTVVADEPLEPHEH
jgi:hypothetical protein